jgi:hypothetical protein
MLSASRGGEYNEPLDLYDHSPNPFSNWHPLGDLAVAEFGLADNVLFMSHENNDSGERELRIAVTHHLRGVYGIKPFLDAIIGVLPDTRTIESYQHTLTKTHKINLADADLVS